MTPSLSRSLKRDNRIVVLTDKEAGALFDLAAALDDFVPEKHPVRTAADKLDEQRAAQMRDPYAEAWDELHDALPDLLSGAVSETRAKEISRAIVDRILGVYA